MLQLFKTLLSFFLIFIIFVRVPQDGRGLSDFTSKSNLVASPQRAQRILDYLTIIAISFYLIIAFKLNQVITLDSFY